VQAKNTFNIPVSYVDAAAKPNANLQAVQLRR
jgi:hypothetical protein